MHNSIIMIIEDKKNNHESLDKMIYCSDICTQSTLAFKHIQTAVLDILASSNTISKTLKD